MSTFTPGPGTVRLTPSSPTGNPYVQWDTTWNNAGTTFTGIRFDVTDTASAAGSLLMDLRVGGASKLSVSKGGAVVLGNSLTFTGTGATTTLSVGFGDVLAVNRTVGLNLNLEFYNSASKILGRSNNFGIYLASGGQFGFGPTSDNIGTNDVSLFRDAANTLAQRNGVNPQAFRVYNTFTDASNYERLSVAWVANACIMSLENAGTGAARSLYLRGTNLYFGGALGANHWLVTTSGHFIAGADNVYDIGNATSARPRNLFLGSYAQLSEMTAPAAPAANSVRIYAEDNGAGKTRLMALFATGAAQQIAIEP
jgi:hypothetical protein